ncbi:MAG: carboxypeptidase-like regulatory domain-containing protein, partial [Patescibacteria group bacterium]
HPSAGQVKDAAKNAPLKEALVQLYNAETGRLMATKVTSETGQFALVPPPGVYTVIVSKAGYQTYRESHVVVSPDKRKALAMTFQLTPEAPQTIAVEGLAGTTT